MRKVCLAFAILIVVGISCHKDKPSSKAIVTPPSFPIAVGNKWTYVYGPYYGPNDTMVVTVLSRVRNQTGDSVYLIQRKTSLFGTDTLFTLDTKDSVNYYNDLALTSLADKYLLPLITGAKWSDRVDSIDTTRVLGIGQVACNGVHYDSIISIRRDASQGANVLIEIVAIKPGIGIIEQSKTTYTGYTDGYSLSLLSYELVQ
jgi:hypothetical protein